MTVRKFIDKITGNDIRYIVRVENVDGEDWEVTSWDVNGTFEEIAAKFREYYSVKIRPPFRAVGDTIDVDRLDVLDFIEERTRGRVERAKILLQEAREAVAAVWSRRQQIYNGWIAAGMLERITDSGGQTDFKAMHKSLFGDDYDKYISFLLYTLESMTGRADRQRAPLVVQGRPPVSFADCLLVDEARRPSVLNTFRILIRGNKGRAVALVIRAGMKAGILQKPPFAAVAAEFGDIGSRAGYNRYVANIRAFDAKELESIVNVLETA